jgi:hypothetical protein
MGLAGTINANFKVKTSATTTVTGQQADAVSWLGTGASSGMSSSVTYGPVTTPATLLPASGTIPLFPFAFAGPSYTNNYQVWAGKCRQMQPPTGQGMATVTPGSNQTVPVQEPGLNLVVNYNGTRVAPTDIKITFNNGTGPSCTDTWFAGISATAATNANGALASPGQPFASTATSGATASASGFTGTLSICADYLIGSTYHSLTTAGVTNTSFSNLTAVTLNILTSSPVVKC